MKKDDQFIVSLDPVEQALLGALAKQNSITEDEQLKRIIRAKLDEAARSTLNGGTPKQQ